MAEDKELQSLTTPKGVYNSFPDKTAREQLGGKLNAPGGVKAGDYLRVQSVGADGTVVLEGAEPPGEDSGQNVALTAAQIDLLENVFTHTQWADEDGARYAAQLIASLRGGESGGTEPEPEEPVKTLVSISAAYSGGNVPVGTAVSNLSGVTVTAHYSDGSTSTVTGYTLSGTISEGDNTVTVTYMGKTAAFTVTGEAQAPEGRKLLHSWALSDADGAEIDTVGGLEMEKHDSFVEETADGWVIPVKYTCIYAEGIVAPGNTIELDVTTQVGEDTGAYAFAFGPGGTTTRYAITLRNGVWGWENSTTYKHDKLIPELDSPDAFNGRTVGLSIGANGYVSLLLDGEFVSTSPWAIAESALVVGRSNSTVCPMTISAVRVYTGVA